MSAELDSKLSFNELESHFEIGIQDEDYTLGELFTRSLQRDPRVSYAGYEVSSGRVKNLNLKLRLCDPVGQAVQEIFHDAVRTRLSEIESLIQLCACLFGT